MQLASAFRALHPQAAVLICSGQVATEDIEEQLQGSVFECLPKPFTERQLARTMRRLLAQRRNHHPAASN